MYLRAFRFQLALLMPDKTAEAVQARLDELEKAAPNAFARLFPLVLTDNGAEFADSGLATSFWTISGGPSLLF